MGLIAYWFMKPSLYNLYNSHKKTLFAFVTLHVAWILVHYVYLLVQLLTSEKKMINISLISLILILVVLIIVNKETIRVG